MGKIDVHCHLLPAVDDGCKTAEESLQCARMLVEAGYSHCFCTPHVWPNNPHINRESLPKMTGKLQQLLDEALIPLRVLPGGELSLHQAVLKTDDKQIVTYGLTDRYILTDMWADALPNWFEPAIRWLQEKGLTVILAHPERMRAVQDNPDLADRFDELGILLQGNLQCFADRPDAYTRITAEQYLRDGRYFMLGSDTHGVEGLKHRLIGLQNATALVGDEMIEKLMVQNPAKLLAE